MCDGQGQPVAQRGFHGTCIERGRDLAAVFRRNLVPFPRVELVEERLEQSSGRSPEAFDLVFAATAWHWVDPEVR